MHTCLNSILGTYIPRKEVTCEELIRASIIKKNQAIKLRAVKETKDQDGNARVTGWSQLFILVGSANVFVSLLKFGASAAPHSLFL